MHRESGTRAAAPAFSPAWSRSGWMPASTVPRCCGSILSRFPAAVRAYPAAARLSAPADGRRGARDVRGGLRSRRRALPAGAIVRGGDRGPRTAGHRQFLDRVVATAKRGSTTKPCAIPNAASNWRWRRAISKWRRSCRPRGVGWHSREAGWTRRSRFCGIAEDSLNQTDDFLSRGNIQSAYGRIARRQGRYERAVEYFEWAIAEYRRAGGGQLQLARTLQNLAFVSRLLALRAHKELDRLAASRRSGREGTAEAADDARERRAQIDAIRAQSRAHLEEALEIYLRHGNQHGIAGVHINRGLSVPGCRRPGARSRRSRARRSRTGTKSATTS